MSEVIAEVGSASANSYVTVDEANVYFVDAFGRPLWGDQDPDNLSKLVISASRLLDQYISWDGVRATKDQALEWPRIVSSFDKITIPPKVKYATYELAYYLLQNNGLSFSGQTIDSVKVGSISVDFTEQSTDAGIPSFIENLLGDLGSSIIVDGNQVRMARLVRT